MVPARFDFALVASEGKARDVLVYVVPVAAEVLGSDGWEYDRLAPRSVGPVCQVGWVVVVAGPCVYCTPPIVGVIVSEQLCVYVAPHVVWYNRDKLVLLWFDRRGTVYASRLVAWLCAGTLAVFPLLWCGVLVRVVALSVVALVRSVDHCGKT